MTLSPSSPDPGLPSSPLAGTEPTIYSPDVVRGRASNVAIVDDNSVLLVEGHKYTRLYPHPHADGTFSNELDPKDRGYISRHIKIKALNAGTVLAGDDAEMEQSMVIHQMKLYEVFNMCSLYYWNGIYLRFDSLDHSCTAISLLNTLNINAEFVDSYEFARAKSMDTMAINEFEGQLELVVHCQPHVDSKNSSMIQPFFPRDIPLLNMAIRNLMSKFGEVAACVHVGTDQETMIFTYRVEFKSVHACNRAVGSINLDPIFGVLANHTWRWSSVEAVQWIGDRAPNSPHRHKPRFDDQGRLVGFRHQESHFSKLEVAMKRSSSQYESHNRVRADRISDGTDVRTTIMLRNIPNKLDWMSLVAMLNEVCFGTFDFVYLRIDFKSCNNVGYAFINFSDINGMIALLEKVAGRGWPGFKSSKFAEISYATIQGREALTQKFRNSSVMQEAPFCRPRLFATSDDADEWCEIRSTGSEIQFPQPDNYSKLQRSMDSARSMGLFPPSGIQQANIHRGIISEYDRGTPRDIVHVANMHRQFAPGQSFTITEEQRRECEAWYASQFGVGQNGLVPFVHIPSVLVAQFLQTRGPATPTAAYPGVIARPAPASTLVPSPAPTVAHRRHGYLQRDIFASVPSQRGDAAKRVPSNGY